MKKYVQLFTLMITIQLPGYTQEKPDDLYVAVGKHQSIHSEILKEDRTIWIHLPDDGNFNPDVRYPVVYILDGKMQMNGLVTVYNYYWGNYLPKMILIGISNQNNRDRDLTISQVERHPVESGKADQFMNFMESELIPYIDSTYPTSEFRILIGHSHAGQFVVNALINRPWLFKNYIAIDPSLEWDDQEILKRARENLPKKDYDGKSLFISLASPLDRADDNVTLDEVAKSDSPHSVHARSVISFANLMDEQTQNRLSFDWKYYPDDIHGSVVLPSILDGLRGQFSWYQLKNASKINDPHTSVESLSEIISEREKLLSAHFGYPVAPADEELLLMGAEMFGQMNQLEKVRLFINLVQKHYPSSVAGYEAMARLNLAEQNIENAIMNLHKAYEISGNEEYLKQVQELKNQDK